MAYKVFTNGSPLPASDLNTYLMNQSVMVFANSTARSAALTAPTEGMVTYLEDTNKVEVYTGSPLAWTDINDNSAAISKSTVTATGDLIIGNGNASVTRLGIGTNGQILQSNGSTAAWVTPSSGGLSSWTLLANGTFSSGNNSYDLTGISGYNNYLFVVNHLTASATYGLWRFRVNGSTQATWGSRFTVSRDGTGTNIVDAGTDLQFANQGGTAGAYTYGVLTILGKSSYNLVGGGSASDSGQFIGQGILQTQPSSITSLGIQLSAGSLQNGTIGTTYRIYGG